MGSSTSKEKSDEERTTQANNIVSEVDTNSSHETRKTQDCSVFHSIAVNDKEEYKQVVEAVKEGNKEAKTKLAWFLLSGYGGVQIDEDRAFDILNERVKDRDAEAMWMMRLCYEYGMGCETSDEEAEALYKRSREGGNAIGVFLVENGERNERGSGVMKVKSLLMEET